MSHHAVEQPAADDPAAPPGPDRAPVRSVRSPVWRRSAALAEDVRAVLTTVDGLAAEARAGVQADRRDPDEATLRGCLEGALVAARPVLAGLLGQVEQLEQYALSNRRWDLDTRLRAVAGARAVDAMALLRRSGEPSQGQVEAAARIERALGRLRPDAEELEHGYEDLRCGLRRLQRSVRDVLGHRVDRPLSPWHLRLLVEGTHRVLSTAAVGLLAALGLATQDGVAHSDAAVAAATAAAAPVEGLVELVGRRLRSPAPEQRLLATHDELTYLVGDFVQATADPARDRLEELYAAALMESAHAARWSQRLGWTAKHDYAVTARRVPVVLAAAMSAARAEDAAGLAATVGQIREVHAALTRYRIPAPARR